MNIKYLLNKNYALIYRCVHGFFISSNNHGIMLFMTGIFAQGCAFAFDRFLWEKYENFFIYLWFVCMLQWLALPRRKMIIDCVSCTGADRRMGYQRHPLISHFERASERWCYISHWYQLVNLGPTLSKPKRDQDISWTIRPEQKHFVVAVMLRPSSSFVVLRRPWSGHRATASQSPSNFRQPFHK